MELDLNPQSDFLEIRVYVGGRTEGIQIEYNNNAPITRKYVLRVRYSRSGNFIPTSSLGSSRL